MANMCTLSRDLRKAIIETRPLLLPVLLCIVLTQVAWVFVYDCTVTKTIIYRSSTGNDNLLGDAFWDGIAKAASAMIAIALVSSVMNTLSFFQCKKIANALLALSCICCSVVITGSVFKDGAARLPIGEPNQSAIAGSLTAVLAFCALLAFFTQRLPMWCEELCMIMNCASMATFYLTMVPGNTAWLLGVWGLCKLALERVNDCVPAALRLLTFTFEDVKTRGEEEGEEEEEEEEEYSEDEAEAEDDHGSDSGYDELDNSSESSDATSESEEDAETEALDFESDLFYGDYIFYSILVGKSMAFGFLPALGTTIGVITGLAWTLSFDGGAGRETLPLSIAFGMLGHYSTVAQMAALEYLYSTLFA